MNEIIKQLYERKSTRVFEEKEISKEEQEELDSLLKDFA